MGRPTEEEQRRALCDIESMIASAKKLADLYEVRIDTGGFYYEPVDCTMNEDGDVIGSESGWNSSDC